MWFIVVAFVAFIIFIIAKAVNTERASQEAGTFTVHQTKDRDAKWLSATISLLEDSISILDAYSQKEHIPYSKITSVTLYQGDIQMRRSKKINIYYSFTLNYKDKYDWGKKFNCMSFSLLDNHKFKILEQRINDEIRRAEKDLNSKLLKVDNNNNNNNNQKINNDLISVNISLSDNSEMSGVSTIEKKNKSKSSTLRTNEVITNSTINPIISCYNEVLEGINTIDSIIDKYLEVTPMELYYSEATLNCLSTCITNNTKTWLSNKILEKRVKYRIMETKIDINPSQDELIVVESKINLQMLQSINIEKTEINNTNVQSSKYSNNDIKMSLMKYEGCNDVSIFARCECGSFTRFGKKDVSINYNIIKIISPYKCKKCGRTYYSFETYSDDKMYYYTKLVKAIDCIRRKRLQNNPISKDENHAKDYSRLISFYNESFTNKRTINDIIQAYLEVTPQELYYEEKRIRCLSLYLFKTSKTYNRLSNQEIIKIIEGDKFKNQKRQSSSKIDYDIVEEYLQKSKNEQLNDLGTDVSFNSLGENDNVHEFNNLCELKEFVEADIGNNPQKYVDMDELANALIDEKTRCFCPQCRSEQTVIIMKNSKLKCLNCDKVYDVDFTFKGEENDVVDDTINQPHSMYLYEDYYYANSACEEEINSVEVGSAVEITLDEEDNISSNIAIPIPEKVSNQDLKEKIEHNNITSHNRNYVVKNNELTSKWNDDTEISFKLTTDNSNESSEERFYKQAQKWENRFETSIVEVEFMQYRPTYAGMTDEQLKWYFTWRGEIRKGIYINTSLSYVYLYIYESVNQIGFESCEEGLSKIIELWKNLRVFHKHLDRYLANWIKDYIIYYECQENYVDIIMDIMQEDGYQLLYDDLLIRFFEKREIPNLLILINRCSNYKILKSKFIEAGYGEIMGKCLVNVLICVDNYLLESTGKSLLDTYFKMQSINEWKPFLGAVFCDKLQWRAIKKRVINKYIYYWVDNNKWYCSYLEHNAFYGNSRLKTFIGDLLKCTETYLRLLLGFKGKLKFDELPIEIQLLIQKEVQANYFKYHPSCEKYIDNYSKLDSPKIIKQQIDPKKQEFVIDVSKLDVLRKESDEIRDKLISEQTLKEVIYISEISLVGSTANNATEIKAVPISTNQEEMYSNKWLRFVSSLDNYQKEALNVILHKKDVNEILSSIARKKLIMREMLIESINEIAFEYIGDNLIDTNDLIPYVYDDYIENILTVIKTEV